jgi:hypothetical protein
MMFLSLRRAPHDSEDKYADTKHGANFRVGHGEYEGGSAETRQRAITVESLLIIIHSNPQNRKKKVLGRTNRLLSFDKIWTT